MVATTGDDVLDRILGGGIPDERSVVVTGGPGTGKSTLAMQFLQAGLENGEQGLFITTEQTVDELRDTFAPFDFDLDHSDLTVTSLHARPGAHFEEDEDEMTLTNLEGQNIFSAEFPVPFRPQYVRRFLDRFGPVDRVAFDSLSGLRPMSTDTASFRRALLDLIRLFTDDFGATTVLTSERDSDVPDEWGGGIDYAVHGVVEARRAPVGSDFRTFVRVPKLRGVDHDTREFGVVFDTGFDVVSRSQPTSNAVTRLQTGIEGVDDLLGGGIVRGGTATLLHDGRATLDEILASIYLHRIQQGEQLVLIPHVTMTPDRASSVVEEFGTTLDALLDADAMVVVDVHDVWNVDHENVVVPDVDADAPLREAFEDVRRRRDESDGPVVVSKNLTALYQTIDDTKLRDLRYWIEGGFLGPDDVVVVVVNQRSLPEQLVEFYVDAARQCLRTWVHDTGTQVLAYEKGPGECVGGSRFVEFVEEAPFVRVRPSTA
ncbi:ATPase domain-containing protein [Halospeciosus flavus]|uniref:ATPase domain-containing protein n=1 Tax=Halospeciosus flavus TaxID=3032283 RepID=A0ABD5Z5A3_9EURY|nr:ATPase domain-containing protein [Halospeciosus flavus]